jgi:hypothetical protein
VVREQALAVCSCRRRPRTCRSGRRLALFAGLTKAELKVVTALLKRKSYEPGDTIINVGDAPRRCPGARARERAGGAALGRAQAPGDVFARHGLR